MSNRTIQEIDALLNEINHKHHPLIKELEVDNRKGVQQLLSRWIKRLEHLEKLNQRFQQMTEYENKYRANGFSAIAGVDEVGRGPLAGPVIAAAVILPSDFCLLGLDDSKKLSEQKREEYYKVIIKESISFGVGIIDVRTIDEINIYQATKKAMSLAINLLDKKPEVILIDAMNIDTPFISESIIKGDASSISIAAASIIAKVSRDRIMKEYALQYPYYGFEQNMGYGTVQHLEAIQKYGITPIHRKSFSPIKEIVEGK